jgi:hypothetical protein
MPVHFEKLAPNLGRAGLGNGRRGEGREQHGEDQHRAGRPGRHRPVLLLPQLFRHSPEGTLRRFPRQRLKVFAEKRAHSPTPRAADGRPRWDRRRPSKRRITFPALTATYQRRATERGVLHSVVRAHLEKFLAEAARAAGGAHLTEFVERRATRCYVFGGAPWVGRGPRETLDGPSGELGGRTLGSAPPRRTPMLRTTENRLYAAYPSPILVWPGGEATAAVDWGSTAQAGEMSPCAWRCVTWTRYLP